MKVSFINYIIIISTSALSLMGCSEKISKKVETNAQTKTRMFMYNSPCFTTIKKAVLDKAKLINASDVEILDGAFSELKSNSFEVLTSANYKGGFMSMSYDVKTKNISDKAKSCEVTKVSLKTSHPHP